MFSQLATVAVIGLTGRHRELAVSGSWTVGRGQRWRGTNWEIRKVDAVFSLCHVPVEPAEGAVDSCLSWWWIVTVGRVVVKVFRVGSARSSPAPEVGGAGGPLPSGPGTSAHWALIQGRGHRQKGLLTWTGAWWHGDRVHFGGMPTLWWRWRGAKWEWRTFAPTGPDRKETPTAASAIPPSGIGPGSGDESAVDEARERKSVPLSQPTGLQARGRRAPPWAGGLLPEAPCRRICSRAGCSGIQGRSCPGATKQVLPLRENPPDQRFFSAGGTRTISPSFALCLEPGSAASQHYKEEKHSV